MIFQGKGTQSRALTRSAVLFPGSEVALDVRCVHQTHGIRSGAEFKYGGITPLAVDSSLYTAGYRPQDQQTMWNAVRKTSASMRARSGALGVEPQQFVRSLLRRVQHSPGYGSAHVAETPVTTEPVPAPSSPAFPPNVGAFEGGADNLKQNFDEFARNFDDLLSKARLHENQAGLALITDKGCKTIEVFDLPASWEAIHKDSVKRMGTELLRGSDNTSVFEYKPENAINAVRKVLGLEYKSNLIYEHKPSNGE